MSVSDSSREEAREYLAALLLNMQALDQTNRTLGQLLSQVVQQQGTLISQLGVLSAQLDGVAQRVDVLDSQIANLSMVLNESPSLATRFPPQVRVRRGPQQPSLGQAFGQVIGLGVDRLYPGGGGRGG